jgi:hypothetical protein
MYDYFLGGKDNYTADRQAAGRVLAVWPGVMVAARSTRQFMHRATRFTAGLGLRQFLDIGTGIPTSPNLHEIAQSIAPESRVVYVDNDPIVRAHAQALMAGAPEGRAAYVHGDLTRPREILDAPVLAETLDLSRPVALSINSLMHFVPDEFGAYDVVRTLVDALPSGSCLSLSHITGDFDPEAVERTRQIYAAGGIPAQARGLTEVKRFFHGLELVDPGVVAVHRWRPQVRAVETGDLTDAEVSLYAGLAVKP